MRKNEHPGCSCGGCKRGKRTGFGHEVIKQVNRRIRRLYRMALRRGDTEQIIVSTPYTD